MDTSNNNIEISQSNNKKIYCGRCNSEIEKTRNRWKICRLCYNKLCLVNNKKYLEKKVKIPKEKISKFSVYKYNKNGEEVDVIYKLKNVKDNKKICKGCNQELDLQLYNIVKNNKGLDCYYLHNFCKECHNKKCFKKY